MTCTCVGADDILRVLAHLVAYFFGQVALGWVLASFPRPSHITLTLAAVTSTVACTGFPVVGLADPVMALTQWPKVGARFSHVTDAHPTLAPATVMAQSAPWGLPRCTTSALGLCPGQPAGGARQASQRWGEALRCSGQPNEEKRGHQQQEVLKAWGMHAELCRREGRPAALLLGGASTGGSRRKKCHQQMSRQKDLGYRSSQVLGSSWRLNCLRTLGQWIRSGRGAGAKLLQWRV